MHIANKTILITGANRGIGRALVDEALRRGAKGEPWRNGISKGLERQFAAFVPANAAA